MRHRLLRLPTLICGALLVLVASPWGAPAQVPGQVDFQGLLLDAAGDPVNGLVDLDFALFTVDTGGAPVWTESHADVSVVDGVYDVALGSATPLTPALLAGGTMYLEISVEGETLSPRRPLLAVPYAVRAAEADGAASLGGFSGAYFSQMIEDYDFDGGPPSNTDPSEGLADIDGDGVANFLDSNNDGDTWSDAEEIAQGSDVNAVTPRITSFSPPSSVAAFPANVTVNGSDFDPAMAVAFGAENPTPTNVSATSFDVSVGSAPVGSSPVMVTLPNGESASTTYPRTASLAIGAITPASIAADATVTVTVTGTGFAPGLVVDAFGTQSPTPMNLTPTSFEIEVGPQASGVVPVMVSIPNGETDSSSFEFRPNRRVITTGLTTGAIGGLAGADALCATAAANSGLAGVPFLPWLADSSESPATRFFQSTIPYHRFDGVLIANSWADLVDGTLSQPIVPSVAWANVAVPSATAAGTSCLDWTSASSGDTGRTGNGLATNFQWTNHTDGTCDFPRVLYCFEQ